MAMFTGLIAGVVAWAGAPEPGTWVQVVTGASHACALDSDGRVQCWGIGATEVPDRDFVHLSAGLEHTCGLDGQSRVSCWGAELPKWPDRTLTHLVSGDRHACGLAAPEAELDGLRVNAPDNNALCVGVEPPEGRFTDLVIEGGRTCFIGQERICVGADLQEARPHCRITAPDRVTCRGERTVRTGAKGRTPPVPRPGHPRHPETRAMEMVETEEGRQRWDGVTQDDRRMLRDRGLDLIRELRELDAPDAKLLFRLNAVTGRLVNDSNQYPAPGLVDVDGTTVNAPWYAAATALIADPELGWWLHDVEIGAAVGYYRDQIEAGALPPLLQE